MRNHRITRDTKAPGWFGGGMLWPAFRFAAVRRKLTLIQARELYHVLMNRPEKDTADRTGRTVYGVKKGREKLREIYGVGRTSDVFRLANADMDLYLHPDEDDEPDAPDEAR